MPLVGNLLAKKINIGRETTDRRGRLCVPTKIDFSTETQITLDANVQTFLRDMGDVQGVYVDNSAGYYDIVIFVPDNQQTVTVAGGDQGYYPLLITEEMRLVITNLNGNIQLFHFYNVPIEAASWSVGGPGTGPQYNVSTGMVYPAYANATDTLFMTGSDSKLVVVDGFYLINRSTAAVQITNYLLRRTTLDTGGAPTIYSGTYGKSDPRMPAPTAVVGAYTSAPVLGTLSDTLSTTVITTATLSNTMSTANFTPRIEITPYPMILDGANQMLVVNWGGVSPPAGYSAQIYAIWREY